MQLQRVAIAIGFVWMALRKPWDAWQFKKLWQMDFWTANTTGVYLVGFNETILIDIFKKFWALRFWNDTQKAQILIVGFFEECSEFSHFIITGLSTNLTT